VRFHNIALFFPFLNITSQKRKFIYTKNSLEIFLDCVQILKIITSLFLNERVPVIATLKHLITGKREKKRKKLYLIKFNHFVGRKIPKSWFAFLGWNKEMKICLTYWTVSSQFKYWFFSLLSKHLSKSILYEKIKLCIQNKTNLIKDKFSL